MTDTVLTKPSASSPKKKPVVKKKAAPVHPSTAVMVISAIKELGERKGSSLPAIKKYLAANYQVDPVRSATYIRKFLSGSVLNGTVLQTKGHYKLAFNETKRRNAAAVTVAKKPIAKSVTKIATTLKKKSIVKKVKSSAAKRPRAPPKTVAKPKKAAAKPVVTASKPKLVKAGGAASQKKK